MDKVTINNTFRKINSEPKALLLMYMIESVKPQQLKEIQDGIVHRYGEGLEGFRSLTGPSFLGYLKASLRPITEISMGTNDYRLGPKKVKKYQIIPNSPLENKILHSAASQALVASYNISEKIGTESIYNILTGAHWMNDSESSAPGEVGIMLSTLGSFRQLYVEDLVKLTDIDASALNSHLGNLDRKGYVKYHYHEVKKWRLEVGVDYKSLKKNYHQPQMRLLIDYLSKETKGKTINEIQEAMDKRCPVSVSTINQYILMLYREGFLDMTGPRTDAKARCTSKGYHVAEQISSILDCLKGKTAVEPSEYQLATVISNYEKIFR